MKNIIIFIAAIVVLSICSCRSSKIDTTVHQTNTEKKQTNRTDSSAYKMQADVIRNIEQMKEMMQQFEFDWQKTNYSPPDSTGKQYPTSTEKATGTSTKQEKETYNQQLQVQIQEVREMITHINELLDKQERNDTQIVEKTTYVPPWVKILIVVLLIAFIITFYKNIKK